MQSEFNPYREWLGIDGVALPPNYYQLLGVPDFEPDPERIWSAAYQRRLALQAKAHGEYAEVANQLIADVDMAETCLLSPPQKREYDAYLTTHQATPAPAAPEAPIPGTPVQQAPIPEATIPEAAVPPTAEVPPLAQPPTGHAADANPDEPDGSAPYPQRTRPSAWGYDEDEPAMSPQDFLPPAASPSDFAAPGSPASPAPQPGPPTGGIPPQGAAPGAWTPPAAGMPATADVPPAAPLASPPQTPMATPYYGGNPPIAGALPPASPAPPPDVPQATPPGDFFAEATAPTVPDWQDAPAAVPMATPSAAPLDMPVSSGPAGPNVVAPGRRRPRAQSNSSLLAIGLPVAGVLILGLLVLFVTESGPFGSAPSTRNTSVDSNSHNPVPPVSKPGPPKPKPPTPKPEPPTPKPEPPNPKPEPPTPKPEPPTPKPNPPTPKTKQEPKAKPADPQQMKLVTAALGQARYWLADRDREKAREVYDLAKKNDPTGAREDDIERIRTLIHYNEQFWEAVKKQCAGLNAGSTITIGGEAVGVVEVGGDFIILRERGRNKRHPFRSMKVGHAYDLAALFLTENTAVTHLILGAFLASEYEGDRAKARGHWQSAMKLGDQDVQQQVRLMLPLLDTEIPPELPPISGDTPNPPEPKDPKRAKDGRYLPPGREELAKAQGMVRSDYMAQIDAAVFDADKAALARKLLAAADDDVEPALRFALLEEARSLAVDGGDFPLALETVDVLEESHAVAGLALRVDLIAKGAVATKDPEKSKRLAMKALNLADEAVLEEQYSLALRLTTAARTAAGRSKDAALIKDAAARDKEVRALKSSE